MVPQRAHGTLGVLQSSDIDSGSLWTFSKLVRALVLLTTKIGSISSE